jgi:glutamyl-tRNA reductase
LCERLELSELAYLATCNRVEFVYSAPEELAAAEIEKRLRGSFARDLSSVSLYFYKGEDAVRHLFAVASSLDSMVVGEAQILGQVKDAFQQAKNWELCGPRLEELFAWAFRTAKKVRRETALVEGAVSIANLVIDELLQAWKSGENGKVILVGVGEMTVKLGRLLAERGVSGLHFVNRTAERALFLARQYSATYQSLPDFLAAPPPTSALVSATSAPEPIFTLQTVPPFLHGHPILMIDLAVPRDISPEVETIPYVTVRRLEDFRTQAEENLAARQKEVAKGKEIVEREALRFWVRFVENEKLSYLRHASVFDLAV